MESTPSVQSVVQLPAYAPGLNIVEGAQSTMKNSLGDLGSCITPDQLAAIVKNRLKPPYSTDSSLRPDSASNPNRPRTRPWPFGLCSPRR